jgi:S-methylmethionine-dependent homocysteine/selenocysteine methylase
MCLEDCFSTNRFILTEGAVGQRIEHEFGIKPDADIMYAGLIYDSVGRNALTTIYRSYLQVATDYKLPILFMTNTRRANKDRVMRSKFKNKNVMKDYASFLKSLIAEYECDAYLGGMMGCKGDAYSSDEGLSTDAAIDFHSWQMSMFDLEHIDFLFAGIMPTLPEAIGMAKVMERSAKPYIISLMVHRNGRILDGNTIDETIRSIDNQTHHQPLCYMTNCVHPSVLLESLMHSENQTERVKNRFCGIQANAACLDLNELDKSTILRTSSPENLAHSFKLLHDSFPLKIYGGCCGTDERHLRELVNTLH